VKPRRRWLRGVLMLLALVSSSCGAWLYFEYATKNAWDVAEAELDRSDPHWRLLEIGADGRRLPIERTGARHRRDRRRWIGPGSFYAQGSLSRPSRNCRRPPAQSPAGGAHQGRVRQDAEMTA